MKFNKITDLNLAGKVIFIRTDMNVPLSDNGIITDDTRIKAGVNTIKYALENGAKVIVATHLGRPTEGIVNKEDSVLPVAKRLGELLGVDIPVIENWQSGVSFSSGNLIMLENVRCNVGEKKNSDELGKKYAALCDVFCYDAFATAHRAEASTNSVGLYAKEICAGLLMAKELEALSKAVSSPQKPVVAVVAGSKVSTKLTILNNLADKVDTLIVGGGILNTFLMANGKDVAGSLVEVDLVNEAKQVIDKMSARGASVPLPYDVVVAEKFAPDAKAVEKNLDDIKSGEMILDIGSSFANQLAEIIARAGTIIWNGPVGVFEFDQFASGTKIVANAIADSKGFSLAGGGDTIAAINKFNLFDKISYVSTAGGALLEFLEGKELPAVKLLTSR